MKIRLALYGLFLLLLCIVTAFHFKPNTWNVQFTFTNTVKGLPLVLNDSLYTNSFGEQYSIKNLKYYISNISLSGNTAADKNENCHLVDEASDGSKTFSISIKPGTYTTVDFTIGVDSLHNVSGAQTGALDPLNGMFWTWNSGYIMAKLEGSSNVSSQVNNRFEYHIGGFSGTNNTVKKISLPFTIHHLPTGQAGSPLTIDPAKTIAIVIEADLDKWWQSPNDIKIATTPVCTTPGELAKKIAANYSNLFSVKTIMQH